MTASRYARLNPLANNGLNATPVLKGPTPLSNTMSDSSTRLYQPQQSGEGGPNPIVKKQGNSTVAESYAYTGADGDIPPRRPSQYRTHLRTQR
jgi:hypothetical protein